MADAGDVVCLDDPRPLRQTACGTKDRTPVQALDVFQKAKQNGKAKYWKIFRPCQQPSPAGEHFGSSSQPVCHAKQTADAKRARTLKRTVGNADLGAPEVCGSRSSKASGSGFATAASANNDEEISLNARPCAHATLLENRFSPFLKAGLDRSALKEHI
eukprot:365900-Chlamydomonas_euryale.AAC.14